MQTELSKMMVGLENHTIFPSEMGQIVVERGWNGAPDAWGSSPKSVSPLFLGLLSFLQKEYVGLDHFSS